MAVKLSVEAMLAAANAEWQSLMDALFASDAAGEIIDQRRPHLLMVGPVGREIQHIVERRKSTHRKQSDE